jgi:hypothetical protein
MQYLAPEWMTAWPLSPTWRAAVKSEQSPRHRAPISNEWEVLSLAVDEGKSAWAGVASMRGAVWQKPPNELHASSSDAKRRAV